MIPLERKQVDSFIQSEISSMDETHDIVMAKLSGNVRSNYARLVEGMHQVQEVDLDISKAVVHVRNGKRMLQNVLTDVVIISFSFSSMLSIVCLTRQNSHLNIVQSRRRADRMKKVSNKTKMSLYR